MESIYPKHAEESASLEAQIQEARRRAEDFTKSLQNARKAEDESMRSVEEERRRWAASYEEKTAMVEQLQRELAYTVEALHVQRSVDNSLSKSRDEGLPHTITDDNSGRNASNGRKHDRNSESLHTSGPTRRESRRHYDTNDSSYQVSSSVYDVQRNQHQSNREADVNYAAMYHAAASEIASLKRKLTDSESAFRSEILELKQELENMRSAWRDSEGKLQFRNTQVRQYEVEREARDKIESDLRSQVRQLENIRMSLEIDARVHKAGIEESTSTLKLEMVAMEKQNMELARKTENLENLVSTLTEERNRLSRLVEDSVRVNSERFVETRSGRTQLIDNGVTESTSVNSSHSVSKNIGTTANFPRDSVDKFTQCVQSPARESSPSRQYSPDRSREDRADAHLVGIPSSHDRQKVGKSNLQREYTLSERDDAQCLVTNDYISDEHFDDTSTSVLNEGGDACPPPPISSGTQTGVVVDHKSIGTATHSILDMQAYSPPRVMLQQHQWVVGNSRVSDVVHTSTNKAKVMSFDSEVGMDDGSGDDGRVNSPERYTKQSSRVASPQPSGSRNSPSAKSVQSRLSSSPQSSPKRRLLGQRSTSKVHDVAGYEAVPVSLPSPSSRGHSVKRAKTPVSRVVNAKTGVRKGVMQESNRVKKTTGTSATQRARGVVNKRTSNSDGRPGSRAQTLSRKMSSTASIRSTTPPVRNPERTVRSQRRSASAASSRTLTKTTATTPTPTRTPLARRQQKESRNNTVAVGTQRKTRTPIVNRTLSGDRHVRRHEEVSLSLNSTDAPWG
mmetsp:Transcript_4889/g.7444  ORF Transcript_4889/g.7444 Transcript_4889/m.7444 type:complete len:791 (-) Transcript_4889:152-2524(-)